MDAARHRSTPATIQATTQPCVTAAPAADVFLSPTGSDANDCTSAAPCQSFARGYRVAAPGQTVELGAGAYPGQQTIPVDSSKTSPEDVLFRPAPGAVATVESLDVFGSHVSFRYLQLDEDVYVKCGADDVTMRDSRAGLFLVASASNVSFVDSEFGPWPNNHSRIEAAEDCAADTSRNVLLDGVYVHDNYTDPHDEKHMECLTVQTADGLTIRNSRFHRCEDFDILFKRNEPSGHHSRVVIENSWFGRPYPDGDTAIQFSLPETGATFTDMALRYNSFASKVVFKPGAVYSGVRVVGNVARDVGCGLPGITFSHNVWEETSCPPTDVQAPSGFVDGEGFDLHLASGAAAIGRGDPAEVPPFDIDGDIRPIGLPDAGSDERP
jgi:hypothetical protein